MYVLTDDDLTNMQEMMGGGGFAVKFGGVCTCDSGYMCHHRIDFITQWMKNRSGMNVDSNPIFDNIENIKKYMRLKSYTETRVRDVDDEPAE